MKEQIESLVQEKLTKEFEDTKESIAVKDWGNGQNYASIIKGISTYITEKKAELVSKLRQGGKRECVYSELERQLWIADYFRSVAAVIDESEGGKLAKKHVKDQADRIIVKMQTDRNITDYPCYTEIDRVKADIMIAMSLFAPGGISDDLAAPIAFDTHHMRDACISAFQKAKVSKSDTLNPYQEGSGNGTPE